MKTKKLSEKEKFEYLVGGLSSTYYYFCLNKVGHDRIEGKSWKDFQYIWTKILVAWRYYYLMGLAKTFDKKNYYEKKTLSIFHIIPKNKFSEESKKTIKKIKEMRDEILAHPDAEKIIQRQGIITEKSYGLDFLGKKINSLFDESFKLLNKARPDYGLDSELNKDQLRKDAEKKFDRWYAIWKNYI